MTTELTAEQIEAFEGMIERRMTNTGETWKQAAEAILDYLKGHAA